MSTIHPHLHQDHQRGDHYTKTGYVVYAPYDQAFPPELQDYPDESQGYLDENGLRANPNQRPELPDSIPRHGQPPLRPYHSVSEMTPPYDSVR